MTDLHNQPAPILYNQPASDKSFVVTWLLAMLLGTFGIDRFYLGKVGTGILKLITFGGFGLWSLIDLILVLTGTTRDRSGLPLAGYAENKKVAWIVTLVVYVLGIIGGASSTASQFAVLNG